MRLRPCERLAATLEALRGIAGHLAQWATFLALAVDNVVCCL